MINLMEFVMLGLLLFFMCMVLSNHFTAFRMHQVHISPDQILPTVSILIPARNEAHNLIHLIPSLLSSNYKPLEILILNDNSEDQTQDVALNLLKNSPIYYQVIEGKKWNSEMGLSGKNYACHQLSQLARGEILIFCDADVTVSKDIIERTLHLIQQNPKASGLSALPKIKTSGLLQQLVFPWIMQIPLMISVPLRFSWRLQIPSMQLANGQWLAVRKEAYAAIGGHQSLGPAILEDVQMAKNLIKKSLGGLIPVISSQDISVQMYPNWKSMVTGFSKNLILIYGGRPLYFIFLLMFVNLLFLYPIWSPSISSVHIFLGLCFLFIIRFVTALAFGNTFSKSVLQFFLHWLSILALNYFSILILKNYFNRNTDWKGRKTFQTGNSI